MSLRDLKNVSFHPDVEFLFGQNISGLGNYWYTTASPIKIKIVMNEFELSNTVVPQNDLYDFQLLPHFLVKKGLDSGRKSLSYLRYMKLLERWLFQIPNFQVQPINFLIFQEFPIFQIISNDFSILLAKYLFPPSQNHYLLKFCPPKKRHW